MATVGIRCAVKTPLCRHIRSYWGWSEPVWAVSSPPSLVYTGGSFVVLDDQPSSKLLVVNMARAMKKSRMQVLKWSSSAVMMISSARLEYSPTALRLLNCGLTHGGDSARRGQNTPLGALREDRTNCSVPSEGPQRLQARTVVRRRLGLSEDPNSSYGTL